MGNNVYRLKVPDGIVGLLRNLHPVIKSQVKVGLKAIVDDPYSGKALRDNLQGLRSYRVKKYRIIYRIVPGKKYLEIIAVGPRRNIYEQTFKLLSRKKKN
jgi:mRNA interferase RelE/StbE